MGEVREGVGVYRGFRVIVDLWVLFRVEGKLGGMEEVFF